MNGIPKDYIDDWQVLLQPLMQKIMLGHEKKSTAIGHSGTDIESGQLIHKVDDDEEIDEELNQ
jgi:hypothetical protein